MTVIIMTSQNITYGIKENMQLIRILLTHSNGLTLDALGELEPARVLPEFLLTHAWLSREEGSTSATIVISRVILHSSTTQNW